MAGSGREYGGYRTAMGYGESPNGRHRTPSAEGGYSGGMQELGGRSYGGHGSTGDYGYGARGHYGESQFGGGDAHQSPEEYWAQNFGWMRPPERAFRRGPKGYRRSDQRLLEDLCETIASAGHLDASEVTVDVQDGRVRLEGTVPARCMKHAIEDLADTCPGVQEIDNRIRVRA